MSCSRCSAYPEGTGEMLRRDQLVDQIKRFASMFDLNVSHKTRVTSTTFAENTRTWSVVINTPSGEKTVACKNLVLATGIGSQVPYIPHISARDVFSGVVIHSTEYKSAQALADKGIKVS